MDRPRPSPRAYKREASGGLHGTINSPKVCLKKYENGVRVNCYLVAETEPCKCVYRGGSKEGDPQTSYKGTNVAQVCMDAMRFSS